ncbi:uncharacterized protein LOC133333774 [Musca vetustissima]|uniref:uncharacterized protein LOC133333774 n=1 Tax=Musca vetustissima TaxID=27455 RepID=UPI002AB6DE2B|nr:uncharacterized protein LOC133333774 [Musca vetustissima]
MLRSPQRTDRDSNENGSGDHNVTLNSNTDAQSQVLNSSNMIGQRNGMEVSAAAVKLPGFWTNCPEAWFIHVEMQFATKGIVVDKTKYEYVITALPQDVIMMVLDVIQNPAGNNRYEVLKDVLIKRHTLSESKRLEKIVADSEIGDQKPSEFYRAMLLLAGTRFSQDMLKRLWIRKLPKNLNVALMGSNVTDINQLIKLADDIWEVLQKDEIVALGISSTSAETSQITDMGKVVEGLVQTTNNICQGFSQLSLEVSMMKRQFGEMQGPDRSGRFSGRSRSGTWKKNWLCRFHYRFGQDARNCEQPCAFREGNSSKN